MKKEKAVASARGFSKASGHRKQEFPKKPEIRDQRPSTKRRPSPEKPKEAVPISPLKRISVAKRTVSIKKSLPTASKNLPALSPSAQSIKRPLPVHQKGSAEKPGRKKAPHQKEPIPRPAVAQRKSSSVSQGATLPQLPQLYDQSDRGDFERRLRTAEGYRRSIVFGDKA